MPLAYEGTDIISYLRKQIYHTDCISYRVAIYHFILPLPPLLCYNTLKVAGFYVVFTPLSTWWTAILTGAGIGWNEYIVLAITMLINFVTEYLFDRFVVFGNSIDTAKSVRKD